jgi:methyl-accepting chemotaxis protein
MGLDYNGIPEFSRKRDLFISSIDGNLLSSIIEEDTRDKIEDRIFDDLARTYLKGEALKEALGDMDKAGFIPVEARSKVISSIQRINPDADNYNVITFGLFKEACEFLHSRSTSLNEDFLGTYTIIDPDLQGETITSVHKNTTKDSGDDWISDFLLAGSAVAGIMLTGYLSDFFTSNAPKATAPDNEVKQWGAQGVIIAVALLIELGITYAEMLSKFGDSNTVDLETLNSFAALEHDPVGRAEILNDAGYDYDALRKNQTFDDYNAIKNYSIEYIKRQKEQYKYHHWISYISVVSSQGIVKHGLAMAPVFSEKWANFSNESESSSSGSVSDSDAFDLAKDKVVSNFNNGLKDYLSSVISSVNKSYDATYVAYNFQIDERALCCMIYFLGPIDISMLKSIVKILTLSQLRFDIDFNQLLSFMIEGTLTSILNMATSYVSKIISEIHSLIMETFYSLPGNDLEAILKICIGMEWLLKIIDDAFAFLVDMVQDILDNLKLTIQAISGKSELAASFFVENRAIATILSMLNSVIENIDHANAVCLTKVADEDLPSINNNDAADAAIHFIAIELPNLFPVMSMNQENSRKYFSNVEGFETRSLGLPVPGTDSEGKILRPLEFSDPVTDCASQSMASESIALGRKLSELFKAR